MAQLRSAFSTALSGFFAGTSALPVANGGTGAATTTAARTALGAAASGANSDITSITGLTTALAVAQGGTGATNASSALSALGGVGISAFTSASPGKLKLSNGFLFQWGSGVAGANTSGTVTFPEAYTTSCHAIVCGGSSTVGVEGGIRNTVNTTTNVSWTSAGSSGGNYIWFAVGS